MSLRAMLLQSRLDRLRRKAAYWEGRRDALDLRIRQLTSVSNTLIDWYSTAAARASAYRATEAQLALRILEDDPKPIFPGCVAGTTESKRK